MVRWAWLDWGLSGWLTTLLQCFDTVGWVIRSDLNCVECGVNSTVAEQWYVVGFSWQDICTAARLRTAVCYSSVGTRPSVEGKQRCHDIVQHQRVSLLCHLEKQSFQPATAYMHSAMYAIDSSSICPSHVWTVDQSKTIEVRIMQFTTFSNPIPLVFVGYVSSRNSE